VWISGGRTDILAVNAKGTRRGSVVGFVNDMRSRAQQAPNSECYALQVVIVEAVNGFWGREIEKVLRVLVGYLY